MSGTTVATSSDRRQRELCAWLIDGDPSVRWQAMADLFHAPPEQVAKERRSVASEGWGARLLALQDPDGTWGQAIYSPKWTSTTYSLLLLQRLGLEPGHPRALLGCQKLWDAARWYDGGVTFAKTIRQPETCITGMLVFLASTFKFEDERIDAAVKWLLDQQLPDGGWNCESIRRGSRHGSFHTSITVLEALLEYQSAGGGVPISKPMAQGREFFLDHQLYRSHRTGEVADEAFTRFPFPPQWHFDIVRGLEHFRNAGAAPDDRLGDAVEVIRRARRSDGTWPMYRSYPGKYWFRMETRGPSRWSTLRALRILQWWDSATQK